MQTNSYLVQKLHFITKYISLLWRKIILYFRILKNKAIFYFYFWQIQSSGSFWAFQATNKKSGLTRIWRHSTVWCISKAAWRITEWCLEYKGFIYFFLFYPRSISGYYFFIFTNTLCTHKALWQTGIKFSEWNFA